MTARIRCAIIGAGAAGAGAAYALSRRGAEVHLFEQYGLLHDKGSSHGPTRLFRTAYFEHPDYVPLLRRCASLWRALEAANGETLLHQTGVMMAGYDTGELVPGTLKAAEMHDLPIESLPRERAAQRFPWFSFSPQMRIFIEPEAGFLLAGKAVATMIAGARESGAIIRDNTPVQGWAPTKDGVEITTAAGNALFDRLIVATGAWATQLLGDIGAPIRPLRKNLFWVGAGDSRFSLGTGLLPFAVEMEDQSFFYGFPAVDSDGVKIAEHTGGLPVSAPDELGTESFLASDISRVRAFMERHAPGLPDTITKTDRCLYEMSPDNQFIIDRHPVDDRVCFAIGLSGHGFKFAPVVGEALAALALGEPLTAEFEFLSLSRFKR